MAIDAERLRITSARLSEVVADPTRWTDLLDEIARAAGAMGAGLLPGAGAEGAMASASLRDCLDTYIREGWSAADRESRRRAVELQLRGQVVFDRDLRDGKRSPFFDDFLPRFGGKWWAGVGFSAGAKHWSLTLHRAAREEPFHEGERAALRQFSWRLSEIGSLSCLAGRASLSDVASAFDQIRKAVVAIDGTGEVIRANAAAERIFGEDVRVTGRRLMLGDRGAAAEYQKILQRLRGAPEAKPLRAAPIIVRRGDADPLLLRALPVDGAARSPFLHARALLLLDEIGRPGRPDWQVLAAAFGLTRAEARLAARLATGVSLESSRIALRIAKETARSQLKSIFQKTDVHRQAELVVLLNSLLRSA